MRHCSVLYFLFTSILLIIAGCATSPTQSGNIEQVAHELIAMEESDQKLEFMVINKDPQTLEPDFFERKDAAQAQNAQRCEKIFNEIGYPTHSLVGQKASDAFWLLIQHADDDPALQERVAIAMKAAVLDDDAPADKFAMLTDRVRINTGRNQLFGSQVQFDLKTCRAMPKPIEDPEHVDKRRAEVGLEPLWKYMNGAAELNFMMNTKHYEEIGVTKPWVYPEGFSDW
tara:strand:+ start:28965 stop:29648 length:684 start_codon:yes stop_codon:yes gene_type:complete